MSWSLAIRVACGIALASSTTAHANAPATIVLSVAECDSVDVDELARLLHIELRGAAIASEDGAEASATIGVTCRGPMVELEVVDRLTGKTSRRSLDLSGTSTIARTRLVALAVTDLVSASWAELILESSTRRARAPTVEKAPETHARQVVRARVQPSPRHRVLAFGSATTTFAGFWAFGGGLRVGGDLGGRLGWSVDAGFDRGATRIPEGEVELDRAHLTMAFGARARLGSSTLRVHGGARLGYARMTGEPARPEEFAGRTLRGPTFGPAIAALVTTPPWGRFVLEGGVLAGWDVIGVRGLGFERGEVTASGPYLAITIGGGFAL